MDPRIIFALLIAGVAAIVCVAVWSHVASGASLYGSTQASLSNGDGTALTGPTPDSLPWAAAPGTGSKYLESLGREGAQWARQSVLEAYVWAAVLLVVAIVYYVRMTRVW